MLEEEKIITYKMTAQEAKAFRLALLWISLTKKFLPEDRTLSSTSLPKGDPRKGYLFKLCWKLLRETKGLLEDKDYKYYFAAQLQMLKNINRGSSHAHISHNVFVGEKAWIRWKVWKKKFDEQSKLNYTESAVVSLREESNLIKGINKTKKFFDETAKSENFEVDDLKNWLNSGKIALVIL